MASRRGWQDVHPPVMRFEYMDRMDQQDDDEREEGVRRARDHGASLPPVKRDGVVEVGRARFSVYSGQGAVEMRRREAESKRLREGVRRSSWS